MMYPQCDKEFDDDLPASEIFCEINFNYTGMLANLTNGEK